MLAFLVAGCATTRGPEPGAELIGTTLRMQTAAGERTTLRFRDRRTVRAEFRGHSVDGRWRVRDRRLCFYWHGAPRECWPYREPFRRGRTLSVTSDRGNVVRVTMR
jgi:hypothetical protein